jgi:hypothetical protein
MRKMYSGTVAGVGSCLSKLMQGVTATAVATQLTMSLGMAQEIRILETRLVADGVLRIECQAFAEDGELVLLYGSTLDSITEPVLTRTSVAGRCGMISRR